MKPVPSSSLQLDEHLHFQRVLERLDQVKYAVLERGGSISVIPKPGEG